jgi:uncharacterized protein (UPF0333 family)
MSIKLALLLAGVASLAGAALGYYIRWLVSLGKKGSVELEIKKLLLEAKEEAKNIIEEGQKKAEEGLKVFRTE